MAKAGNQEAYNSLQVIAGQLDCSICANRLSDPKDLDCSHTFCCKCLTDYARSKKLSTVIACPLCRQNTVLPPGGITYLKTNYLLRDVIDAVPLEDARLPKRRLDPLEEKDGTRTCGVHNGVARDIYCATCNVLVCQKCIGTGHCSTGHSHYSLHTRASYARNYLKTLSSESADKLVDLDSMQDEIRKAEETLRENRQKTMEKIGEHVMKVTTVVLEQQSSLIKEVDAKYQADVEALEREKERIATLRENLQQYHDETQMTARNQDDETVVLLESKLDSDKKSHQRQEFNLRITQFDFTETSIKFGSLTTKSRPVKATETVVTTFNWKKNKEIAGSFNRGLAVSPCGTILAICKSNEVRLYKTDNGLFISSFQGSSPECLQSPQDLVFLKDGNLAVIDAGSPYVRVFTEDGRFVDKFNTLEANEYKSLKVKLSCIGYDKQKGVIVIGDINRKVLTFHHNDGTILQTLHLNKIDPVAVDINVEAGLVAVTNLIFVHIVSMTGKGLLVLERYGDTKWPLAANAACFDANAKSVFVTRSMPFGEKSILQYAIPSGKYIGCIYKDLSGPTRLTFFKNNMLAVADGSSVKMLMNAAESEI